MNAPDENKKYDEITLKSQSGCITSTRENFYKSLFLKGVIKDAERKRKPQPFFVNRPHAELEVMVTAMTDEKYKMESKYYYALPFYQITTYKLHISEFGESNIYHFALNLDGKNERVYTLSCPPGWYEWLYLDSLDGWVSVNDGEEIVVLKNKTANIRLGYFKVEDQPLKIKIRVDDARTQKRIGGKLHYWQIREEYVNYATLERVHFFGIK